MGFGGHSNQGQPGDGTWVFAVGSFRSHRTLHIDGDPEAHRREGMPSSPTKAGSPISMSSSSPGYGWEDLRISGSHGRGLQGEPCKDWVVVGGSPGGE